MTQSAQAKAVLKGIATLAITTILFFLVYDSVINRVIPYVKLKLVDWNGMDKYEIYCEKP